MFLVKTVPPREGKHLSTARRLGFEPREALTSRVFKTRALNQTLPSPHIKKVLIKELFSEHPQSPSSLVARTRVELVTPP